MSRSRRIAIDVGGGDLPGYGPPSYQSFNASGYTIVALPTPINLGMPAPAATLTIWSEGLISIGDPTAAQIQFMQTYDYPNVSHDVTGFPGAYMSVGYQDGAPAAITLQSGPSEHPATGDTGFFITWGDPYASGDYSTGSQFSEAMIDGSGFTLDPGFYDGSDFQHSSGESYNIDDTIGFRLGSASYSKLGGDNDAYHDSTTAFTLTGGAGGETIQGGDYAEVLVGGSGGDTLTGGGGADWFRYAAASDSTAAAPDHITDFQSGTEKIDARGIAADGLVISGAGALTVVDVPTAAGTLHIASDTAIAAGDILLGDSNVGAALTGTAGADQLYGFGGNDNLSGGLGADRMVGGLGNDTYHVDNAGDVVVEAAGQGTDLVFSSIGYTLPDNVENLTLTGSAGINATGNALDNVLTGTAGSNVLDGGAGANDTASFANATAAVTASLATHQATGFGADTLSNIENLTGSAYADTLTGDGKANVLTGGAGDDRLDGGGGGDTASYAGAAGAITVSLAVAGAQATGGAGGDTLVSIESLIGSGYADHLTGSAAANMIEGGLGNDVLDGGGGIDTASYAHATVAVTVSLALTSAQNTIGAGSDTLAGFENLTGSDYNDTLTGNAGDNYLAGGLGDDLIAGGLGNDTLSGSIGSDTATYANAAAGITASLVSNTATGEGSDIFRSIDNLIGSAYADHLTGSAIANIIEGGLGNDVLDGGGTGDGDTVSYVHATRGVTVTLALTSAQDMIGAGSDTLANFENIAGSGYADTLTGSAAGNVITAGAGNDILDGGAGDDTLDGGAGNDIATFAAATAGVTASLLTGHATGFGADTLIGIENLTGSGFNDVLTGDAHDNYLAGGGGDDLLTGGAGDDIFSGSYGSDTASFAGATAGVTVNIAAGHASGEGSDTLKSIENIVGSSNDDTLTGDGADNILNGGLGTDTIDGGGGNDTASYAGGGAVTVDLGHEGSGNPQFTGGGTDTLISIENVIGSRYADTFHGSDGDNGFTGGDGSDTITGNGGHDHFYFDTAPGDKNFDTITDFSPADDGIYLNRAVFAGIAASGGLDPSAFALGTAAADASDRILYDPASGLLRYDADGTGGTAAVAIAQLPDHIAVNASDFFAYL